MATNQIGGGETWSMHAICLFPPLEKGGQGGFFKPSNCKSPSITLFQRGRQSLQALNPQPIGRIMFAVVLLVILAVPSFVQAQNLSAAEKQKIEALIRQVGELKEAKFIRNGWTYEPSTAVQFLRGKWDANLSEVKSARDFIDKVATISGTSGKPYLIRFKDGKEIKSGDFLLAELKKIES
jgi:uncharacterized protein DUF5329